MGGEPLDFTGHAPRAARTAALLQRARAAGSVVEITYRSSRGALTERAIQPLSFSCVGGAAAVTAFCTLRSENRTFLLDSIIEVRPVQ